MTWTPEGKRKKRRHKTTWRKTVEKERKDASWRSWEEARSTAAANRENWKYSGGLMRHNRRIEDSEFSEKQMVAIGSCLATFFKI